jgi:hypothetical protein
MVLYASYAIFLFLLRYRNDQYNYHKTSDYRVGESLQRRLSSSHTTVRTVRYTAVHKFSATFKYWESMDG